MNSQARNSCAFPSFLINLIPIPKIMRHQLITITSHQLWDLFPQAPWLCFTRPRRVSPSGQGCCWRFAWPVSRGISSC